MHPGNLFSLHSSPSLKGGPSTDGSADFPHLNESSHFSSSQVRIIAFIPKFVGRLKVPIHAVLLSMSGIKQALRCLCQQPVLEPMMFLH